MCYGGRLILLYLIKRRGDFVCEMCEKPTKEYGRCSNPSCGYKLCSAGYEVAIINALGLQGKIYLALSWEDD